MGVSWFGAPLQIEVDLRRERSLRFHGPDLSPLAHLEHTVRARGFKAAQAETDDHTHVLIGLESVPRAFEITANKGKFQAINLPQVVLCQ